MASLKEYQVTQKEQLEELIKTIDKGFYDTKDAQTKSDLSEKQSNRLTKIRILDNTIKTYFDLNLHLKELVVKNKEKYPISKKRGGRGEFVQITQAFLSTFARKTEGFREALGI